MFIFNYFSKFAFVILSWFWLALIWILVLVPLHFHAFFPYSSKTFVICCCWYSGLLNWFYLFWWCSFPLVLKRLEFLFHISQSWKLKMTNNQCQQIFIKVINDQPSRKNFFVFFFMYASKWDNYQTTTINWNKHTHKSLRKAVSSFDSTAAHDRPSWSAQSTPQSRHVFWKCNNNDCQPFFTYHIQVTCNMKYTYRVFVI